MNKSNYFVSRKASMKITFDKGKIQKLITLTINNSANTELGVSGRYKTYIRLLVPEDSEIISVTESTGQNTKAISSEITDAKGRKEVGILTEILGGQTKQITFVLSSKHIENLGKYQLYIRKQAGVDDYPFDISFNFPNKVISSNPAFTLTNEGNYVYNTTLTRDLFTRLSF